VPPSGRSFLGFDPLDVANDASSAQVSNFDLDLGSLTVE